MIPAICSHPVCDPSVIGKITFQGSQITQLFHDNPPWVCDARWKGLVRWLPFFKRFVTYRVSWEEEVIEIVNPPPGGFGGGFRSRLFLLIDNAPIGRDILVVYPTGLHMDRFYARWER